MCDLAVDLAAVCARHGRDLADLADEITRLSPFISDGLIRLNGARLEVVGDGRLVVRSICAIFDSYFEWGAVRHAKAL
jgi:oxygen-independent coproporphyrinogen-3 oxidase